MAMNKTIFLSLTESCFVCENVDDILLKARISKARGKKTWPFFWHMGRKFQLRG